MKPSEDITVNKLVKYFTSSFAGDRRWFRRLMTHASTTVRAEFVAAIRTVDVTSTWIAPIMRNNYVDLNDQSSIDKYLMDGMPKLNNTTSIGGTKIRWNQHEINMLATKMLEYRNIYPYYSMIQLANLAMSVLPPSRQKHIKTNFAIAKVIPTMTSMDADIRHQAPVPSQESSKEIERLKAELQAAQELLDEYGSNNPTKQVNNDTSLNMALETIKAELVMTKRLLNESMSGIDKIGPLSDDEMIAIVANNKEFMARAMAISGIKSKPITIDEVMVAFEPDILFKAILNKHGKTKAQPQVISKEPAIEPNRSAKIKTIGVFGVQKYQLKKLISEFPRVNFVAFNNSEVDEAVARTNEVCVSAIFTPTYVVDGLTKSLGANNVHIFNGSIDKLISNVRTILA